MPTGMINRGRNSAKFFVSATSTEHDDQYVQHYRDSNGVETNDGGGVSFDPVVNAFVDIDYTATFASGFIEAFAFDLSVSGVARGLA